MVATPSYLDDLLKFGGTGRKKKKLFPDPLADLKKSATPARRTPSADVRTMLDDLEPRKTTTTRTRSAGPDHLLDLENTRTPARRISTRTTRSTVEGTPQLTARQRAEQAARERQRLAAEEKARKKAERDAAAAERQRQAGMTWAQRQAAARAEAERKAAEANRLAEERRAAQRRAHLAEVERRTAEANRREAERAEAERQRQEAERQRREAARAPTRTRSPSAELHDLYTSTPEYEKTDPRYKAVSTPEVDNVQVPEVDAGIAGVPQVDVAPPQGGVPQAGGAGLVPAANTGGLQIISRDQVGSPVDAFDLETEFTGGTPIDRRAGLAAATADPLTTVDELLADFTGGGDPRYPGGLGENLVPGVAGPTGEDRLTQLLSEFTDGGTPRYPEGLGENLVPGVAGPTGEDRLTQMLSEFADGGTPRYPGGLGENLRPGIAGTQSENRLAQLVSEFGGLSGDVRYGGGLKDNLVPGVTGTMGEDRLAQMLSEFSDLSGDVRYGGGLKDQLIPGVAGTLTEDRLAQMLSEFGGLSGDVRYGGSLKDQLIPGVTGTLRDDLLARLLSEFSDLSGDVRYGGSLKDQLIPGMTGSLSEDRLAQLLSEFADLEGEARYPGLTRYPIPGVDDDPWVNLGVMSDPITGLPVDRFKALGLPPGDADAIDRLFPFPGGTRAPGRGVKTNFPGPGFDLGGGVFQGALAANPPPIEGQVGGGENFDAEIDKMDPRSDPANWPARTCPEGQVWDDLVGTCVPAGGSEGGQGEDGEGGPGAGGQIACPEGQVRDPVTGLCMPAPAGETGGEGETPTAEDPCPSGMHRDASGQCVPDGSETMADPCPSGMERNEAGECVPVVNGEDPCPAGMHRDSSGQCVPDGSETLADPCPAGMERNQAGECVPVVNGEDPCPAGMYRDGSGQCVPEGSDLPPVDTPPADTPPGDAPPGYTPPGGQPVGEPGSYPYGYMQALQQALQALQHPGAVDPEERQRILDYYLKPYQDQARREGNRLNAFYRNLGLFGGGRHGEALARMFDQSQRGIAENVHVPLMLEEMRRAGTDRRANIQQAADLAMGGGRFGLEQGQLTGEYGGKPVLTLQMEKMRNQLVRDGWDRQDAQEATRMAHDSAERLADRIFRSTENQLDRDSREQLAANELEIMQGRFDAEARRALLLSSVTALSQLGGQLLPQLFDHIFGRNGLQRVTADTFMAMGYDAETAAQLAQAWNGVLDEKNVPEGEGTGEGQGEGAGEGGGDADIPWKTIASGFLTGVAFGIGSENDNYERWAAEHPELDAGLNALGAGTAYWSLGPWGAFGFMAGRIGTAMLMPDVADRKATGAQINPSLGFNDVMRRQMPPEMWADANERLSTAAKSSNWGVFVNWREQRIYYENQHLPDGRDPALSEPLGDYMQRNNVFIVPMDPSHGTAEGQAPIEAFRASIEDMNIQIPSGTYYAWIYNGDEHNPQRQIIFPRPHGRDHRHRGLARPANRLTKEPRHERRTISGRRRRPVREHLRTHADAGPRAHRDGAQAQRPRRLLPRRRRRGVLLAGEKRPHGAGGGHPRPGHQQHLHARALHPGRQRQRPGGQHGPAHPGQPLLRPEPGRLVQSSRRVAGQDRERVFDRTSAGGRFGRSAQQGVDPRARGRRRAPGRRRRRAARGRGAGQAPNRLTYHPAKGRSWRSTTPWGL